MSQQQNFILSMTAQALADWTEGTESCMFPIPKGSKTPADMIFWGIINAMAYGFERGMELGTQIASEETEAGYE